MQASCAIYLFHRDLRLYDNTGLYAAHDAGYTVIPVFIFDPQQVGDNPYRSNNAVQFMCTSLQELEESCQAAGGRLYFMYGDTVDALATIVKETGAKAVYSHKDYTPFSRIRDDKIAHMCAASGVEFHSFHDTLLHVPDEIATAEGNPYRVFTPFNKKAHSLPVKTPREEKSLSLYSREIFCTVLPPYTDVLPVRNEEIHIHGGRSEGSRLLQDMKKLSDYDKTRDIPSHATTYFSAHIKFGTLSIREVYMAIVEQWGEDHTLVSELNWHDFFTHIAWHYPHVFGSEFNDTFRGMEWNDSAEKYDAWCSGRTGFPIIDAGMRQLNETGFMHNRVRMIVASFLVKDLHIDWRKGEQYFAQHLIDYDPSVNNGNWQWAASTGCDAQPWFRIFNPWLQQKKYDPEGIYIKKWVSELRECDLKNLHTAGRITAEGYPAPIVNHTIERKAALLRYKGMREKL